MSNENRNDGGPRRPLLANGELLNTRADRSRGGGDKYHPLSVDEAHALLAPQAERLQEEVLQIPPAARGAHVVIEATLHPNYLAGSYCPHDVLEKTDLYVVGSRLSHGTLKTKKTVTSNQPARTLLLAGAPKDVVAFARLAATSPDSAPGEWKELREFSELCLPPARRVVLHRPDLAAGEVITWESVLSPIGQTKAERDLWMEEAFSKWTAWIANLGGEVATQYRRRVGDLTFVPIALHGEALDAAAQFNLLRALRPMPGVRTFPEAVRRAIFQTIPRPKATQPLSKEPVIAVFDGGVDVTSPYFAPFVTSVDITNEPPDAEMVEHGTLVTSALLYGHIDPAKPLPSPLAPVRHYRVFPTPPSNGVVRTELYWMLDRIVETVERDGCSLVNCSLGPDECVNDQEPTRWTAELDALAHRKGVTIVCAAGNNGAEDEVLGFNRIQVPSDMVNGIGVGACSSADTRKPARRATYSAVGPGREGQRIQPTVVAFGGSDGELFRGVDPQGRLLLGQGTSFSAPMTTRALCDVQRTLDRERRQPAITRAFGVHFAERRRGHRPLELGHGRVPPHFEHVWDCEPHTCTVIYEQELRRDGPTVAMRFPVPSGIAPSVPIEIEWTIGFTTEVDPKDPVDYTLSGLEMHLRPHERLYTLTDPSDKRNSLILNADVDGARMATLIGSGWTRSDQPRSKGGWRKKSEAKQRDEGKWETVIRGRLAGDANTILRPRLDVTYLRRAAGSLVSGPNVPPLKVVMLATVRSPKDVPLYDLVRSQFRVLTPLISVRIPIAA